MNFESTDDSMSSGASQTKLALSEVTYEWIGVKVFLDAGVDPVTGDFLIV